MPSQHEITEGFFKRFRNIDELPCLVWPNVSAKPEAEHVRIFVLPVRPFSENLGCDTWLGVVQATVYVKENTGLLGAHKFADRIIKAFPRRSRFNEGQTNIEIVNDPYTSTHFTQGAWCQVPVSINYEAS